MSSPAAERIFHGAVASAGLVTGRIHLDVLGDAKPRHAGTAEEERAALESATAAAATALADLMARSDDEAAAILEFQVALLEDPELTEPALKDIAGGVDAGTAWRAALDAQIADYEKAEEDYFRARALDLADLRDRVSRALMGDQDGARAGDLAGAIYVGEDLTPSRFLEIDWGKARGAALMKGSASGHVAILARARGVPLVIGLQADATVVAEGATAILDAETGCLIQAPAPATAERYDVRLGERAAQEAAYAAYLMKPAALPSGEFVRVLINVDDPALLKSIDPASCDGVGLTRTEFLFHGKDGLPDEDRQLAVYRLLLDWAGARPVTIRTLDAGGDKPIPGLTPEQEDNSFLGVRGLRLSLAKPEVFRVQVRALLRATPLVPEGGALKVMLPMVTAPREFDEARSLFEEELADLSSDGIAAAMPRLGMMVEVPAAALRIDAFDADFFSIGSNDLVQYVTACSRDNPALSGLYDPLDPAVLELIGRVVADGRARDREVSLCGDMAADPAGLRALLSCGLRAVSVAPAALARVKAEIAGHG